MSCKKKKKIHRKLQFKILRFQNLMSIKKYSQNYFTLRLSRRFKINISSFLFAYDTLAAQDVLASLLLLFISNWKPDYFLVVINKKEAQVL